MFDYYEVAAFAAARIMSAVAGKRVKDRKLFDRKRAEKQLFRKERSDEEMRERYERMKKVAREMEVLRNGRGER
jgi:hypothetical protein